MDNCAFTIVAKNYIGLALILEKSIRKSYNNLDFYIVVADELEKGEVYSSNILEARTNLGISHEMWVEMSFKYNLTEFCTSIKPASFLYFIQRYEKVIYLDPDILFYSSIGDIFDRLDSHLILMTPHVTQLSEESCSDSPENIWFQCGIYNLGFLAIKRSSKVVQMLKWWNNRLINYCFNDPIKFTFTDQKWMDFIPSFFNSNELWILEDLGFNVAPWNFFERKILVRNGKYFVVSRISDKPTNEYPLYFVHYSGYDYRSLYSGSVKQCHISDMKVYDDISLLLDVYSECLNQNHDIFLHYIHSTYSYNTYSNGYPILLLHRCLYHGLLEKGHHFDNPFEAEGNSFYKLLKKKGLNLKPVINVEKISKKDAYVMSSKLVVLNKIFRFIFRIIGYHRYLLLLRFMRFFSRYEAQIHLLDSKHDRDNIF